MLLHVHCALEKKPKNASPCSSFWIHSGHLIFVPLADFLYKTAFLKSKFKDDPVRVHGHNVPHFKGLE